MSKKKLLADFLLKTNMYKFISYACGILSDPLIVLAYHRVCDIDENFSHDSDLVSASVKGFDEQMEFISENFNPISFKELYIYIQENRSLPKKSIIITFDDGYMDNYVNAYPILKKYSISACFFISTGYIGTNEIFWFDDLYHVLQNAPMYEINEVYQQLNIDVVHKDESSLVEILEYLKHRENKDRIYLVENISQSLAIFKESGIDYLNYPMVWECLQEMVDNGMEVESHTVSHPILSKLDAQELDMEISLSKSDIENHLKKEVNVIAYPAGNEYAFNDLVIESCKKHNYGLGVSYIKGRNYMGSLDKYAIKRLHIESHHDLDSFRIKLNIPSLFDDM